MITSKKELTPEQWKRSNHVMGATMIMVYIIYAVVAVLEPSAILDLPNWCFIALYGISIIYTLYYVRRHATEKKAMVYLCSDFTFCYSVLVFTQPAAVMVLVFPVIMAFIVYLNTKVILLASQVSLIVCILKIVQIVIIGGSFTELNLAAVVFLGCIICAYGGIRTTKLLVAYSEEDMKVIETKVEQQELVAKEVSNTVEELDGAFKSVMAHFTEINRYVDNTSEAISAIADGSETTAKEAQTQTQMTSEIQERLENTSATTQEAVATVKELHSTIQTGKTSSDELEEQSILVDKNTEEISETVQKLVEEVGRVSDITSSILAISSQTNLLALNASIEAARAGEAGKGFAVVADQIRQLAEETRNSTEMITQIIGELVSVTQHTQQGIEKSVESIRIQREKVKEVNDGYKSMEQDIQALVEGMDIASTEIEAVMNANHTIVDGVTTLSQISEEISSSTQSSKSDIERLVIRLKDFSHIVDDTFERLLHLEETASVGTSEVSEEEA